MQYNGSGRHIWRNSGRGSISKVCFVTQDGLVMIPKNKISPKIDTTLCNDQDDRFY
jgi:hypothetical protein